MKTPVEIEKEIKELKESIITWGMSRLRSSNIEKQKKLKELIKKLSSQQSI
tara:strand:+ start:351 stop:503 length:153 start_codon:yes stop_codon:yes gene_type:complete